MRRRAVRVSRAPDFSHVVGYGPTSALSAAAVLDGCGCCSCRLVEPSFALVGRNRNGAPAQPARSLRPLGTPECRRVVKIAMALEVGGTETALTEVEQRSAQGLLDNRNHDEYRDSRLPRAGLAGPPGLGARARPRRPPVRARRRSGCDHSLAVTQARRTATVCSSAIFSFFVLKISSLKLRERKLNLMAFFKPATRNLKLETFTPNLRYSSF
jgi:hypothetical protein